MRAARLTPEVLFLVALALAGCGNRTSPPAGNTAHTATLTWNASQTPVESYHIYRSTNPDSQPVLLAVTEGNVTRYVDRSVEAGRTYYYSIKAAGPDGAESAFSARISATIPAN